MIVKVHAIDAHAVPFGSVKRYPDIHLRVADLSHRELAFAIRLTHPAFKDPETTWWAHSVLWTENLPVDFDVAFVFCVESRAYDVLMLVVEPIDQSRTPA